MDDLHHKPPIILEERKMRVWQRRARREVDIADDECAVAPRWAHSLEHPEPRHVAEGREDRDRALARVGLLCGDDTEAGRVPPEALVCPLRGRLAGRCKTDWREHTSTAPQETATLCVMMSQNAALSTVRETSSFSASTWSMRRYG